MKPSQVALAAMLLLTACGNANTTQAQDGQLGQPTRRAPETQGDLQASFAPVVQVSAPAVVNIAAQTVVRERDPFFEMFGRGRTRERVGQSVGSGVIVRSDGIVVTNNHVIDGARQIMVTLNDRREFPAEVILADPRSDLAVLRLDTGGERLPVMPIDDSSELHVGDLVLAIGNPFGIGQTVTSGIISALDRSDGQGATAYIQTDAAINQGNSGGALVDMDGDLIGINTMILSPSGTSAGVGFAVPSAMVRRVVESAAGGETAVTRAWLGVSAAPVTASDASRLGLGHPRGVLVNSVYRGGPAANAGVRQGDVITAVGGQTVDDAAALNFRIGVVRPGEQVELTVVRDGAERTLRARVEAPPGDATPATVTIGGRNPFTGAVVANLTPALADQIGADPMADGVILTGVSGRSYAAAAGFRPGDIVRSLNGQSVGSTRELEQLLSSTERGWDIVILRNGQEVRGRF
ncbi:Do family serine endopeptidase [Brevundimonas aveniformis]|uniref:Do family serine endopeptidase n=1 Tax=Brevundimonas aveniformis TaxID=370977 RepID=UPI00041805F5|nr:Do family serine endopeptidase [Brevundimonas aveniformis]